MLGTTLGTTLDEPDVAIVGGGLCGLALADRLRAEGRSFLLFEARDRLGGRILTTTCARSRLETDLGATWFWPRTQPRITRMVAELGLPDFPQHDEGEVLYLRDPDKRAEAIAGERLHDGARRLEGGMARLVAALHTRVGDDRIRLGHVLTSVADAGDRVELGFDSAAGPVTVSARRVVLALPPRLVDEAVRFTPGLGDDLHDAMRGTATWMASRAKVVVGYDAASWRAAGQSGNAFATHEQAVLGEIFDACGPDGRRAALDGAALGGFVALSPELRQDFATGLPLLIASQLGQLFGPALADGAQHYQDWATEPFTCAGRDRAAPALDHVEAGNPLLRRPEWGGKLHWAGSETASQNAGYLEGALDAAARAAAALAEQAGLAERADMGADADMDAIPASGPVPASGSVAADQGGEAVNAASLARWRVWVMAQETAVFDAYRERLNRALAAQQREQLTQRALLDAMESLFGAALGVLEGLPFDTRNLPVQRGRCVLTPEVQEPFGRLMKSLADNVVAFNRTSCALSNFPDEHRIAKDYMAVILRDIAAAWQEFSLDANRLLLAKGGAGPTISTRDDRAAWA